MYATDTSPSAQVKINRFGGPLKQDRPWTPYERGQMENHYRTVGPREMANRLRRTVQSVKQYWLRMREDVAA